MKLLDYVAVWFLGIVAIWFVGPSLSVIDAQPLQSITNRLVVIIVLTLLIVYHYWRNRSRLIKVDFNERASADADLDQRNSRLLSDFLDKLIEALQREGYQVGPDQVCSAYDVVLALEADKKNPRVFSRYKYLLSPIFCTAEGEQELFYRVFNQCAAAGPDSGQIQEVGVSNAASDDANISWIQINPQRPGWVRYFAITIVVLVIASQYNQIVSLLTPADNSADLTNIIDPSKGNQTGNDGNRNIEDPTDITDPSTESKKPVTPESDVSGSILWDKLIHVLSAWQKQLPVIVTALVLMLTTFIMYRQRGRKNLYLRRQYGNNAGDITRLHVRRTDLNLFTSAAIHRASNAMKRHRHVVSGNLDVNKSVEKSIRNGGYFQPVYALRPTVPEHLVLVDRVDYEDHMRHLVDAWLAEMRRDGMFMDIWYFNEDPRFCTRAGEQQGPVSFDELLSRYEDHRIIIISNTHGMFDTVNGAVQEWVSHFSQWQQRAIVTPQPTERWGFREAELSSLGFAVVPLSSTGFATLGEYFFRAEREDEQLPPPISWPSLTANTYPAMLWRNHNRWLSVEAPNQRSIDRLCQELKIYLGQKGYLLLTACAMYPKTGWNLTLYLDHVLFKENTSSQERQLRLLNLARLPWFQHNYMPDYLCAQLLKDIDKDFENRIRLALDKLMLSALNKNDKTFAIDVALATSRESGVLNNLFDLRSKNRATKNRLVATTLRGLRHLSLNFKVPFKLAETLFRQMPQMDSAGGAERHAPKVAHSHDIIKTGKLRFYKLAYALTTLFIVATISAYFIQQEKIDKTMLSLQLYQKQVNEIKPSSDLFDVLPVLTTLEIMNAEYQQGFWAWTQPLGANRVARLVNEEYQRALIGLFLRQIMQRLEKQMRASENDLIALQDALTTYLMFATEERRDPAFIRSWLNKDWQQALPNEEGKRLQLNRLLDNLLALEFPSPQINNGLVQIARATLSRMPLEQRIYSQIKRQASVKTGLAFRLEDVLKDDGRRTFRSLSGWERTQQIPDLYTSQGYKELFVPRLNTINETSSKIDWVLGEKQANQSDLELTEISDRVNRLYNNDYASRWNDLLTDLDIQQFNSLRDGAEKLDILSSANSPIRALLEAVASNTSEFSGAQAVIPKVFSDLNQMLDVSNADRGPAPIEEVLSLLKELHALLDELASASNNEATLNFAKNRMTGEKGTIDVLRTKAARMPEPVKRWLIAIADQSWKVIFAGARAFIDAAWKDQVLSEYNRALKGRYPISRNSQQEVTLADFTKFFASGGTLPSFFDNYLKEFVNVKRNGLQLRITDGRTIGLSKSTLDTLRIGRNITNVFFANGGTIPAISFQMKPIFLDATVSKFTLTIESQQITYGHGPARSQTIQWPEPERPSRSGIQFQLSNGKQLSQTMQGPWGFYRLLDKSKVQSTKKLNAIRVTFEMEGYQARYELSSQQVLNPFDPDLFARFSLPSIL